MKGPYPVPLSIESSQKWEGNDGPWSTLALRVGISPQHVRVLVNMGGQETWVVGPGGCTPKDPKDCPELRGGLFSLNESISWVSTKTIWNNTGLYNLGNRIGDDLGIYGAGEFGFETVGLSYGGVPVLNKTIVASTIARDYYLGEFGLSPRPSNFTVTNYNSSSMNDPQPSYLSLLKASKYIPSLSWGFSAGSYFRSISYGSAFSSLTLGGFDQGRIRGDPLAVAMAPDDGRELKIALKSIYKQNATSVTPLLETPILTALDSSQPFIWLPRDACDRFELELELTRPAANSTRQMYLLSNDTHASLVRENPTFTFELSSTINNNETLKVVIPYGVLDLTAKHPIALTTKPFFPLKCAANHTQYVLGRSFLQEIYIAADYERRNFSVYQAQWPPKPEELVAILPIQQEKDRTPLSLILGLTLTIAALLLAALGIYCVRRQRRAHLVNLPKPSEDGKEEPWTKPELDGEEKLTIGLKAVVELDPVSERYEVDGQQNTAAELEGCYPPISEMEASCAIGEMKA